jgi:aryl-alcohol dehydrogenase-like predicted oxidoreductase
MKLGFGTWGIGGRDYGPISEKKSITLLKFAIKNKINFFDTAPLYGDGRSEFLIGKVIKVIKRSSIKIATKGGMLPHVGFNHKHNFSIKYLKKEILLSLKRLNTDYIDYYLLHSPNLKKIALKKVFLFSKFLKKKKIIKKFGISLRTPNDIFLLKKYYRNIDIVEFNFNLLDQRAIDLNIFELLKRFKIKSICRTPLCFGFLQTKDIHKKQLSNLDHRKKYWSNRQFNKWNISKNYFKKFIKKNLYKDISQFALHFCMSYNFNYVIPGMMKKKDIVLNLESASLKKINSLELNEIYNLYKFSEKKIFVSKK